MIEFIYKHKDVFLKIKRKFNKFFKIEIIKYPTPELDRRIKLLKHYNIDVVLDVGANIGQYGSELRNIGYNGRIISFEPTTAAFKKLDALSKNDKKWEVYNLSLGDVDGEIEINISENSVSSSISNNLPSLLTSAPKAKYINTETVKINKLDTIFEKLNITNSNIFLKLDTQGYEEKILNGSMNCINKITGIQVEMSLLKSYEDSISFEQMIEKLKNLKYNIATIESGYYDKSTGKLLEIDGVFFRNK